MTFDFLKAGRDAARAVDDKKAENVLLLDVARFSSLADFYLLATAESSPHLRALADHVSRVLWEKNRVKPLHRDGRRWGSSGPARDMGHWIVLDFGGLVVHLMSRDARAFYSLERLWEDARAVSWRKTKIVSAGRLRKKSTLSRKSP